MPRNPQSAKIGKAFKALHSVGFKPDQFASLVETLLPLPTPPARLQLDARVARQFQARVNKINETRNSIGTVFAKGLSNGTNIPPAEETLWGALNAVTAFVDHQQEIDGDRYAHALFGSGAILKEKAYELVVAQLPKN